MRLVDDHRVGQLRDALKAGREVSPPAKVRMAKNGKVTEVSTFTSATDVRETLTQVGFPNAFLRCFRREEHYPLSFM